jgi:penicillin-binding protein 1C
MRLKEFCVNILIGLVGICLALQLFLTFWPYPELAVFRHNPYSLHILDRSGTLLSVLSLKDGQKREYAPLSDMPPVLLQVFINAEDAHFFSHNGFDPSALVRALAQNLSQGEIISGASTITMQLARLISPHDNGYGGKLWELFHALLLESRMSKEEILELWLNSIPFGFNTVGVASAAKVFFGVPLQHLSPAQCVLLALIPRSPAKYNPLAGGSETTREITQAALKLAGRIGIPLTAGEIRQALSMAGESAARYRWPFLAPHFVNYVAGRLSPEDMASGKPVYTSLDLDLHLAAAAVLKGKISSAYGNRIHNGACLLVDNASGEILAYVGSQDYFDDEFGGQIDGIQIRNQPGSTLKPYLYAMALDNGFTASSILPDIPSDFGGEEVYIPLNFNERFNGPVRLRVALASSLNIPAVHLLERLGVKNFTDKLIELGFDSIRDQASSVGIGLALGNAEVSLYELVGAFGVFTRNGRYLPLTWKKMSPGDSGYAAQGKQVFHGSSAGIICDILSDRKSRIAGFGPSSILNTPFPAIFKTGTSNQFNNIWAIGATPRYTMGVWMGNFSGQTVIGAPGSSLPAQVVVQIFSQFAGQGEEFPPIPDVHKVEICTLSGGRATPLCPAVTREYFTPGTEPEPCSFHVEVNGQVMINYPAEYQLWARESGRSYTSGPAAEGTGDVRIVHPGHDSVFFFDPGIDEREQAIRLEVISSYPDDSLELFLDGRPVARGCSPLTYTYHLNPGRHTVWARGTSGSDQLQFDVR